MISAKYREENTNKIKKECVKYYTDSRTFSKKKDIYSGLFTGGIPLAYSSEEKTVYIDSSDTHAIIYGATGSQKTRTIVMPAIKIMGIAGESLIINDSKGELYSRLAGELYENGYEIIAINLRKPSVGNAWNPLYIPYQFYLDGDMDKASEFANDIANNLMNGEKMGDDPFWNYSASDLFFGLILLLFKYCKDNNLNINSVNISNLMILRRVLFKDNAMVKNSALWKYASEDELIAASLSGTVFAPNDTRNSILSVFDQHMRTFTIQPTLMDMLSNNDFDIASISEKKTAVFMITPDEKTSFHKLVSLFIKQSYEYIIHHASLKEDNKLNVRVNFVLDEFSSLPTISDMPAMISAARSRNIRFLLVVQSKSSLKKKYQEEAETIISNCSDMIFFTSREIELLRELSELCGRQKNGEPNLSVYDLQHLNKERREALVISNRIEPAIVNMIDIDQFGEKTYSVLGFTEGKRETRNVLDFELPVAVKEKYTQNSVKTDTPIPLFEDRKRIAEEKYKFEEEKRKFEEEKHKLEEEKHKLEEKVKELEWQEMLKDLDTKIEELPGGEENGD